MTSTPMIQTRSSISSVPFRQRCLTVDGMSVFVVKHICRRDTQDGSELIDVRFWGVGHILILLALPFSPSFFRSRSNKPAPDWIVACGADIHRGGSTFLWIRSELPH